MHSNFQGVPPLAYLLFLGLFLGLVATAVLLVCLLVLGKRHLASLLLRVTAAGVLSYFLLLVGSSVASRPDTVPLGEEKYFCEVDCHLAYSVADVARVPAPAGPHAGSIFWVVTLRVRFDETTISPHRGSGPLTPNPRSAAVIDEAGRVYRESMDLPPALGDLARSPHTLMEPLRPGESYVTKLVFELPPGVTRPRLLLSESAGETRLLIGHENSFLHRKTLFALATRAAAG